MTTLNLTPAHLQSRFPGKTILVIGSRNIFKLTDALGLAIAFNPEDVAKLEQMQQQIASLNVLAASFKTPLEYVWLQERVPEDLPEHLVEDTVLPFWTPEMYITGDSPTLYFKEEGDTDSAGNMTTPVDFKLLHALLAGDEEAIHAGHTVRDASTGVYVYSDLDGSNSSAKLLASMNKGFVIYSEVFKAK